MLFSRNRHSREKNKSSRSKSDQRQDYGTDVSQTRRSENTRGLMARDQNMGISHSTQSRDDHADKVTKQDSTRNMTVAIQRKALPPIQDKFVSDGNSRSAASAGQSSDAIRSTGTSGESVQFRRALPSSSREVDVAITSTSLGTRAQSDLWSWIPQLPQSHDDETIKRNVEAVFALAEQYIDNFYEDKLRQGILADEAFINMEFPALPGSMAAKDILAFVENPTVVIKHCLVYIILSCIAFDADSPYSSLLPTEFTVVEEALRAFPERADRDIFAALSAYRVLLSHIRSDVKLDQHYLKSQRRAIKQITTSIETVFRPWMRSDKDDSIRLATLDALLKATADLGLLLFSQSSTFVFNWQIESSSAHEFDIAISPRLLKINDEQARQLKPNQLVVNIKVLRTTSILEEDRDSIDHAEQLIPPPVSQHSGILPVINDRHGRANHTTRMHIQGPPLPNQPIPQELAAEAIRPVHELESTQSSRNPHAHLDFASHVLQDAGGFGDFSLSQTGSQALEGPHTWTEPVTSFGMHTAADRPPVATHGSYVQHSEHSSGSGNHDFGQQQFQGRHPMRNNPPIASLQVLEQTNMLQSPSTSRRWRSGSLDSGNRDSSPYFHGSRRPSLSGDGSVLIGAGYHALGSPDVAGTLHQDLRRDLRSGTHITEPPVRRTNTSPMISTAGSLSDTNLDAQSWHGRHGKSKGPEPKRLQDKTLRNTNGHDKQPGRWFRTFLGT